jgi:hypothetical protein
MSPERQEAASLTRNWISSSVTAGDEVASHLVGVGVRVGVGVGVGVRVGVGVKGWGWGWG